MLSEVEVLKEELLLSQEMEVATQVEDTIPMFISEETVQNLTIRTILIPVTGVDMILATNQLTDEFKKQVVNDLVDSNPQRYHALSEKEAKEQIYLRLLQETVAYYLRDNGYVDGCQQYSSGIRKDGSVSFEAYYFEETEETINMNKQIAEYIKSKQKKKQRPVKTLAEVKKLARRRARVKKASDVSEGEE